MLAEGIVDDDADRREARIGDEGHLGQIARPDRPQPGQGMALGQSADQASFAQYAAF